MGTTLAEKTVAFSYEGTDVIRNGEGLVSLTDMWKANGSLSEKKPNDWASTPQGSGFIANVQANSNTGKSGIWKTTRGKHSGGTWAHWQIAVAYAKYLSHDFHRFVNEAFREWAEEKADPGLKAERAVAAFERAGKASSWIARRFSGIGNRNQLTATMADHNCKVRGKNDNPFAEGTKSISLAVLGKTPKEIRSEKGLAKSARTRDHLDESELISIEWAEIQARKLIKAEASDGNVECVDACRRAGRAVKLALASLSAPA